jgi:predicted transcriptional regulator
MSITIDLPNEIYERLKKQAQARGTTIAEAIAQALEESEAARISAFWERMEAEGLVAKRKPAPPTTEEPFQPIEIKGKPLSEVIIEERH